MSEDLEPDAKVVQGLQALEVKLQTVRTEVMNTDKAPTPQSFSGATRGQFHCPSAAGARWSRGGANHGRSAVRRAQGQSTGARRCAQRSAGRHQAHDFIGDGRLLGSGSRDGAVPVTGVAGLTGVPRLGSVQVTVDPVGAVRVHGGRRWPRSTVGERAPVEPDLSPVPLSSVLLLALQIP